MWKNSLLPALNPLPLSSIQWYTLIGDRVLGLQTYEPHIGSPLLYIPSPKAIENISQFREVCLVYLVIQSDTDMYLEAVTVHYVGKLQNGKIFDSSVQRYVSFYAQKIRYS